MYLIIDQKLLTGTLTDRRSAKQISNRLATSKRLSTQKMMNRSVDAL